jgi:hypothetical protein
MILKKFIWKDVEASPCGSLYQFDFIEDRELSQGIHILMD